MPHRNRPRLSNSIGVIYNDKLYVRKSDGNNQSFRASQNQINRYHARRYIEDGFPMPGKFKTQEDLDDYFGGDKIQCLMCGRLFGALGTHLYRIHGMRVDDYKERFGLPWGKGLCGQAAYRKMVERGRREFVEEKLRIPAGNPAAHEAIRAKGHRPKCEAHAQKQRTALRSMLKKNNYFRGYNKSV